MSKSRKQREQIFRRYAENLMHYVNSIEKKLLYVDKDSIFDITGSAYLCPLCWDSFLIQQVEESKNQNYLSLEDNPPKSMGGRPTLLTCRKCNNTSGAKGDKVVLEFLSLEAFLLGNNNSFETKFKIDGNNIRGTLHKVGKNVVLKPMEKSNPRAMQNVRKKMEERKTFNVSFNLSVPEWSEYSLGMLKIAYLKGFEWFGYYFADWGNGGEVRDAISGKIDYPIFNNGVIDRNMEDEYLGAHVIVEPDELKSIIITQKIKFLDKGVLVDKNISVIFPLPLKEGWESLKNFNQYKNGNISFSSKKIPIEQIPVMDADTYYAFLGMRRS